MPSSLAAVAAMLGLGIETPAQADTGAFYAGMTRFGLSAFTAITVFGLTVAGIMELIRRWHLRNALVHGPEVQRLLAIAQTDGH